jgi:cytolysin (calcineurin-like family phosphatase)
MSTLTVALCRLKLVANQVSFLLLVLALAGAPSGFSQQIAGKVDAARDFTFFLISDIHLGAENLKANPPITKGDTLARVKANLDVMRTLVGRPYPEKSVLASLAPGSVAAPRALIILGDITDGHKIPAEQEDQRSAFDNLFPVDGIKFGEQTVPVFACAGNHDGDVAGPQRRGLVLRNRQLAQAGHFAAISTNGIHFALNWSGVHLICLNLCPADTTDASTPFKYGKPGPGSWNDPQGALLFLKDYLARYVGTSGAPVVIMQHYGFDSFSLNDWNWWTPKQRGSLYELLKAYNVAAFFHGHNHHAEHYRWPDPKRHNADLDVLYNHQPPANPRQYDILSCGNVCWVIRIRGDQLIAAHFKGPDWTTAPAGVFVKSLKP